MTEHGFVLETWTEVDTRPVVELHADLDSLAARLAGITLEDVSAGLRVRWRRQSQEDVWLYVESGGYPLKTAWRCEFCNTQILPQSIRPEFVLASVDGYAPHGHDGQSVTIEAAKKLAREAYAALAEVPGQSWVTLTAIFNYLGEGYSRNLGGRNNPRRTAEIAIGLMGERDLDVALNTVPFRQEAGLHQQPHSGGWADAVLIGPHLPKPIPDEEESW